MDPFAYHLPSSHFRPEAYVPPDVVPRPAGAKPMPVSAFEAHLDRRPNQPVHNEATTELDFADLLDVINPLQHIPVIGDLYRALTGDQISAPARVAGGALFGGPLGFVSGLVNAIADEIVGENFGTAVVAAIFGDGEAGPEMAQTAASESDSVPAAGQPIASAATLGPQQQPLTGAAALRALGADLRKAENLAIPIPAAFIPAAIDARHLAPRQLAPRQQTGFSERMIEALGKYSALVTEKNTSQTPSVKPVDTKL
ncbi:MAG: hypothetical protein ACTSW2_08275 [Alphaproteobacteria bacterium]